MKSLSTVSSKADRVVRITGAATAIPKTIDGNSIC